MPATLKVPDSLLIFFHLILFAGMTAVNPTSEFSVNKYPIKMLIKRDDSFGPIKGTQPEGTTTWATNYPHAA
jgi:hypothetical protein